MLAAVVTVVGVLPVFLTGALAVQMQDDLRFGAAALGVAIASFRVVAASTAPFMGRVTDRLGGARSMRYAALVAAAAAASVAVGARHWVTLALFLGLSGLANALGQTAANHFIVASVRQGRQGLAFGVKQSALPAATSLAGLTVPVFALTVGWRWAFVAAAAIALLVAASVPRMVVTPAAATTTQRRGDKPPLLLLAVGLGFGMGAAGTLTGFLVDTSVRAGFSPASAGLLLTMGSVVAMGSRLLVGYLADRRDGGHLRVVAGMLLAGSAGYFMIATQHRMLMLLAVVVTFGMGWGFNGLFWYAIVRNSPGATGSATGAVMPGGLIGAIAGPILFGLVAEGVSYPAAWSMLGVSGMLGALAMLLGRRSIISFKHAAAS